MKKEKQNWIDDIMDGLDDINRPLNMSPGFKHKLERMLLQSSGQIKMPLLHVLAMAASFLVLVYFNFNIVSHHNEAINVNQPYDQYESIIEQYNLLPANLSNTINYD